jgi:hypothetical protein
MSETGRFIKLSWNDVLEIICSKHGCQEGDILYTGAKWNPPVDLNSIAIKIEMTDDEVGVESNKGNVE